MRRKRRRIEYYSGESTQERFYQKVWFPFVAIAVAALVLALIIGAILGGVARKSRFVSFEPKDMVDFGGVETPERKYRGVIEIHGDGLLMNGMDAKAFRGAISDLPDGNAVSFLVYDGAGAVYFDTELAKKSNTSLNIRASVTASDIVEAVKDKNRYGVGLLVTGAFHESDEQLRVLKVAEEIALISELASAGLHEIVIVGLPSDSDRVTAVNGYLRQAREVCPNTTLGVAIPSAGADSAGVSRLVASTEAYADSYVLDLRNVAVSQIGGLVERNAYFLTTYNMRVMLSGAERDTLVALVESYGLKSYLVQS